MRLFAPPLRRYSMSGISNFYRTLFQRLGCSMLTYHPLRFLIVLFLVSFIYHLYLVFIVCCIQTTCYSLFCINLVALMGSRSVFNKSHWCRSVEPLPPPRIVLDISLSNFPLSTRSTIRFFAFSVFI